MKPWIWCVLAGAALGVAGCDSATPQIPYDIVANYPHDATAYTQGLLFHDGALYESTGRYGESTLRRVDPETGEVLASIPLDSAQFGEGLALAGDELAQLTWKSGTALFYDLESLELKRTVSYEGEGWGLCFDGESFYMSNGGSALTRRNRETFAAEAEIQVVEDGFPLARINELECVGEHIYANVYPTERIVRIDKRSGEVLAEIDGFNISMAGARPPNSEAVLNGIAYIPETDVFLVTGKWWPRLLAIRLSGP